MKKLLSSAFMLISILGLNSVLHQVGAYYADNLYYSGICVDGNTAYVTDAALATPTGFMVLDVSNPANPVLIGSVNDPHELLDVAIYQNRAYIAAGNAGLQVWEISNPGAPSLLTTVDLGGNCEYLTISGDKLYASVRYLGLRIYDIADVVPVFSGGYAACDPYEVSIVEDIAYIADANAGLRIVNVGDPEACTLIGTFPLMLARSLVVEGNILFLMDCHNDCILIDVTDPANPVMLSEIYEMWIKHAYLQDGYLFAMKNAPGTGSRELKVYDISNPSQPQYSTSFVAPSYAAALAGEGNHLYLLIGSTGLLILDISEVINTSLIAGSRIPGSAIAMKVVRDLAYIVDEDQRIVQMDISEPSNPRLLSQLAFTYPFSQMVIEGDIAYVTAHEDGLFIIQLRQDDPPWDSNFEILGVLPSNSSAKELCISGNLAYLANMDNFQIIDIEDASAPQIIGQCPNNGRLDFLHIAKYQNYVYAGGWSDSIGIIDVSDASSPFIAGTFINPSITVRFLIYDHYLFQSNYMLPMRIYDVSSPDYPALAGLIPISPNEWAIPFIFEHYLFLSFPSSNTIKCYDLSNPASPILVKDYAWNLPTYDLFYRQGLLYTCNGDFGFSILAMELPNSIDDPHQVSELVSIHAYPNPFSTSTTLSYKVEGNQKAQVEIYNLKGQMINRVFSGPVSTGTHTINWDGTDDKNRALGSGIYIAKLTVGQKSIVKRIIRVH